MRLAYRAKQLILLFGDLVTLWAGFWLALVARHGEIPEWPLVLERLPLYGVVIVIWIVLNYINGLYDLAQTIDKTQTVRRLVETSLLAMVVGMSYFYLSPDGRISPKTTLILAVIFGYGLSGIWRVIHRNLLDVESLTKNILFVGYSPVVDELLGAIHDQHAQGYRAVAVVDPSDSPQTTVGGIEVYTNPQKIRSIINTHHADIVVVAPELKAEAAVKKELYELLFWPVQIVDLSHMYEIMTGRISPTTFSESWFLEHLNYGDTPVYNKLRRITDLVASIVIGLIFAVLVIPVSLLIRATSKGPVFIKQQRVGRDGKEFTLYKFRSMYALSADGSAEVDGVQFATKKDKRITPIGKVLRKTRIDEIPQVINLIRRDVSLVGPRPERPEIVNQLTERMPHYRLRHLIQPGLTGWAVLHQNYTADLETSLQKLQYDLYYIKNRSFLLDISILLKTVNVIVRARGQ